MIKVYNYFLLMNNKEFAMNETEELLEVHIPKVIEEEINRVDYARSYDMTNLEVNLFYNQKEHNLDEVIEQDYVDVIYEIRDSLIQIRKRKTEIRNLRSALSIPEKYMRNMLKDIYDKSTSNIRSLKITLKKTNEYIDIISTQIDKLSELDENTFNELHDVLNKHLSFFNYRKMYYEGAIDRYKQAIDYSKEKEDIKKNNKSEFKELSIKYVNNLSEMISIEEKVLIERESFLSERLDFVKKSLDFYRNNISKSFK